MASLVEPRQLLSVPNLLAVDTRHNLAEANHARA
jgi:hypothetical protein